MATSTYVYGRRINFLFLTLSGYPQKNISYKLKKKNNFIFDQRTHKHITQNIYEYGCTFLQLKWFKAVFEYKIKVHTKFFYDKQQEKPAKKEMKGIVHGAIIYGV